MSDKLNNTSICILGMHRSGTSSITRGLNLLGVYLGETERMIKPQFDNPKGFWEHSHILAIHERILTTLDKSWDNIWPIDSECWKQKEITNLKQELCNLLLTEFSDKPLWGWKDPRTCLILPAWKEFSQELHFEIRYVIVLRNPVDVTNSLKIRNNFPLSKSYLLWKLYLLSALEETKDAKRIIVSYEEFMTNWKPTLRNISRTLAIPWPSDESLLSHEIESFLDKDLQHSQSSFDELTYKANKGQIPVSIVELYQLCLKAERDNDLANSATFKLKIADMYQEHISIMKMVSSEVKNIRDIDNQIILQKEQLLDLQRKQIKDIINTWSWKLTKPLRWFGNLLLRS